jgi:hypothetical protein
MFSIGADRAFSNSFIAFLLLLEYGNCENEKLEYKKNTENKTRDFIIAIRECA